jgi:oxygen-independent coproporphyrinogen III oxidase
MERRCVYDSAMVTATEFNPGLIRRYDGIGPRYTSYPTAPRFSSQFGAERLMKSIRDSNEDPIPRALSLYAHIPFCFSPCFYCGCNRIISRDAVRKQSYLDFLLREISLLAPLFDRDRDVVQLHLGGGTPNSLNTAQLSELMDRFAGCFRFAPERDRDFSIEIDPRTVDPGDIAVLRSIGFNRVSLGVQDFDPQVQRAINRLQDTGRIRDIHAACRESGFSSVNFDLIYGLPMQNAATFAATLETVGRIRPDRIALYSYAHMPELFKAQNKIDVRSLPDSGQKLALFQLAVETLIAQGYVYIGMDHFALPEDELVRAQESGDLHRNFMGYTTRKQTDLVGFGVSAISQIADCYAQNAKDIPAWSACIEAGRPATVRGLCTDADDRIRAEVIQAIMCRGNLRFDDIETRFDVDFGGYFRDELDGLTVLADDGLLVLDAEGLQVLPAGRLLLRAIAARFDAYLPGRARATAPLLQAL